MLAFGDENRREIVFNPNTGEILRDYWADLSDARDVRRSDRPDRIGNRRRIISSSDDNDRNNNDDDNDSGSGDDHDDSGK